MLALLLVILIGIGFAYFATQNTTPIDIYLGSYYLPQVPVYLVILFPLAIGFIFSSLVQSLKTLKSLFRLSRKESELEKSQSEITRLTKRIHELEIENTRLKTKSGDEELDDDSI